MKPERTLAYRDVIKDIFPPYIIRHPRWPPRTEFSGRVGLKPPHSFSGAGCYRFPDGTLGFLQGKARSPKESDLFCHLLPFFSSLHNRILSRPGRWLPWPSSVEQGQKWLSRWRTHGGKMADGSRAPTGWLKSLSYLVASGNLYAHVVEKQMEVP